MSETVRKLILASTSPRRRDLLREAGFGFSVEPPGVVERGLENETPAEQARRLARDKARAVASRVAEGSCVLAADTLVVLDGVVLGKPRDERHAVEMLLQLAGRTHEVLTGFAVALATEGPVEVGVERSRVELRTLSRAEAETYAATGEPLDKAGAYALQGLGGRVVAAVEGLRSNVLGLPLEAVVPILEALGVKRLCRT